MAKKTSQTRVDNLTAKILDTRPRIIIECNTDNRQKVKSFVIERSDHMIKAELPSGFIMTLEKKPRNRIFICRIGQFEFITDGWELHK